MESKVKYLNQEEATQLDVELMGEGYGFTTEQLMELAGLAASISISEVFSVEKYPKVLLIAGPGNNGGDGLVMARHLFHFGYKAVVLYPKRRDDNKVFKGLQKQCEVLDIQFLSAFPADVDQHFDLLVDAVFGYSFQGTSLRAPFDSILANMNKSKLPIVSVDVPSGWDIDKGNVNSFGLKNPTMLISLAAPKLCAKDYDGIHYLGGRFIPPVLAKKYELNLPTYPGSSQVICISKKSKL